MAAGTIDGAPVVSTADKRDLAIPHAILRVTAQTGMQLLLSRRSILPAAKLGQGRKTTAPMCTGNVDAPCAMARFAAVGRGR